jgi:hypothetical protein
LKHSSKTYPYEAYSFSTSPPSSLQCNGGEFELQETLSVEITAEHFLDDHHLLRHYSITIRFQFDIMGVLKSFNKNNIKVVF